MKYDSVITRRRTEWSLDRIRNTIEKMFKVSIELLKDKKWSYVSSEWVVDESDNKKKEELKNSIYDTLKITLKMDTTYSIVTLHIPTLLNNHFFYLVGQLKVAMYQLFDMPIIYRESDKPVLKFRNNIISVGLLKKKNSYCFDVFGKLIPAHLLIQNLHSKEEVSNFLQDLISEYSKTNGVGTVSLDILENTLDNWIDDDEKRLIEFSNVLTKDTSTIKIEEKKKKATEFLFSVNASNQIDIFTKTFMKTTNIDFELIRALFDGPRDDRDLSNKRIRFLEYLLIPLLLRLYDITVALKKHNSNRFKIQPNIILEKCLSGSKDSRSSVGNIVRYNNIVNPIGELAELMQCTLTGPGSFAKENVPPHLRDLHESHFKLLCPADTPDREGCGVIYNIIPSVQIDEHGKLIPPESDKECVSYPISLVPFLEYDDPTRLQMASSQIKQTIPINDSETPLIQTGWETEFLNEGLFLERAKSSGFVIHVSPSFMCVLYDEEVNGRKVDIFQIGYKSLYLDSVDYLTTNFIVGSRLKKGDVLYYSKKFIKNNKLSYGRNFLTVIMPYYGYNYEDGIVISESAAKKMISTHEVDLSFVVDSNHVLLSLKNDEYVPIYRVGTKLNKGDIYAKLKNLDWTTDINNLNAEVTELKTKSDCVITQLRIYPNAINKSIREYVNFIETLKTEQIFSYSMIVTNLQEHLSRKEVEDILELFQLNILDCKTKQGLYYYKKKKIKGMMLDIKGVYEEELKLGDKLANRHGNKGVIALILPDDEMPMLEDGRRAEIIINPLGITTRMNVGQLYELSLGESLYQLKQKMLNMTEEEVIDLLDKYLELLYSLPSNIHIKNIILNDFKKNIKSKNLKFAINELVLFAPPFISPKYNNIKNAMKLVGAKEKQLVTLTDKDGNRIVTKNPVAIGYLFFEKLVHRASEKMFARSVGPYNKKTLQPSSGRINSGGHRLGEMEAWALLAHDSKTFLKDLLTTHSDSVGKKIRELSKMLRNPSLVNIQEEFEMKTKTQTLFESYLRICGLDFSADKFKDAEDQNKQDNDFSIKIDLNKNT